MGLKEGLKFQTTIWLCCINFRGWYISLEIYCGEHRNSSIAPIKLVSTCPLLVVTVLLEETSNGLLPSFFPLFLVLHFPAIWCNFPLHTYWIKYTNGKFNPQLTLPIENYAKIFILPTYIQWRRQTAHIYSHAMKFFSFHLV